MKKTIKDFEDVHGQPKIKELERRLAMEQAKLDAFMERKNKQSIKIQETNEIIFGLIGCTHFGSIYCNIPAIEAFYEYVASMGIDTIYHGGDVLDGHKVYRGQEFEVNDVGLDRQLKRLTTFNNHGITTKFITGNHDQSFKSGNGAPIGDLIEGARMDFEFLGEEQARVEFQTSEGKYELMLIHPGGGSSYALSYRPQKIVESLEGGTKPNMLAIAHYHKAEFMPSYRNVATIQTGTFQNQTPFMARQGLAAHVGGWIVRIKVHNDYNAVSSEFISFYD